MGWSRFYNNKAKLLHADAEHGESLSAPGAALSLSLTDRGQNSGTEDFL